MLVFLTILWPASYHFFKQNTHILQGIVLILTLYIYWSSHYFRLSYHVVNVFSLLISPQTHLPNIKVHAYFAPVTPPPSVGGSRQRFCRCCVLLWCKDNSPPPPPPPHLLPVSLASRSTLLFEPLWHITSMLVCAPSTFFPSGAAERGREPNTDVTGSRVN